jgi:hypothetical protein
MTHEAIQKKQRECVAAMKKQNDLRSKFMAANLLVLSAYPLCMVCYVYAEAWLEAAVFFGCMLLLSWLSYRQWKRLKRDKQMHMIVCQAFKSTNPNFLSMALDQVAAYSKQLRKEEGTK